MPSVPHLRLGVNIDHVATIRNARGGRIPIRCGRRSSRSRPAPTASPRICARTAATSATTTSRASRRRSRSRSISRWRRPTRWSRSRSRRARMPPAWCRSGARSAPPKAGSTSPASATELAPAVAQLRGAGIRVSLFIAADPAQIEAAAAVGAPVIEIHTGAWCDALAEGRKRGRARRSGERIRDGARLAQQPRPRSPCRPRPRLCDRRDDRGAAGDRRAQHRPFPDRRGDVRSGLPHAVAVDARGDGPRPGESGGAHDPRHRLRPHATSAASSRSSSGTATASSRASSPRPSAPRRSAGRTAIETYAKRFAAKEACAKALGTGFRAGVFWRDMGVVNLPSGRPTMQLTGGALERLRRDHAAGPRGADRPHHHRRRADGAGARDHLGGAEGGLKSGRRGLHGESRRAPFAASRTGSESSRKTLKYHGKLPATRW